MSTSPLRDRIKKRRTVKDPQPSASPEPSEDDEALRLSAANARLASIEAMAHALLQQLDCLPFVRDERGAPHPAVRRLFGLAEALRDTAADAITAL
jgi:hypothetical protein